MADETDVKKSEKSWWYETRAQQVIAALQRRRLSACYVPTKEDAFKKILEFIPAGATVGWGDSTTLFRIGVLNEIKRTHPGKFFDSYVHNPDGSFAISRPKRIEIMRQAAMADVFLAGINAVTLDGRIVNTDAIGNRVAPIIFGPRKVILVAGVNKIVNNLDDAFNRVKMAAAINLKRHVDKHLSTRFADMPCLKKGECMDCTNPYRICRNTVIIEGEIKLDLAPDEPCRINVILVGEELGI